MEKILLDNNAIDFLFQNEEIFIKAKKNYQFFVSASVVEELANIPDEKKEKRIKLFISLCKLETTFLNDSCCIVGFARFGVSNLGEGKVYKEILKESKGNVRDAILADTAVSNGCVLLTDDKGLSERMRKHGYKVVNFEEFKEKNNG